MHDMLFVFFENDTKLLFATAEEMMSRSSCDLCHEVVDADVAPSCRPTVALCPLLAGTRGVRVFVQNGPSLPVRLAPRLPKLMVSSLLRRIVLRKPNGIRGDDE